MNDAHGDKPRTIAGVLRCAICERTQACELDQLWRYVEAGWPVCCGEVMILYVPGDRPDLHWTARP